jgi:hypothetical protein
MGIWLIGISVPAHSTPAWNECKWILFQASFDFSAFRTSVPFHGRQIIRFEANPELYRRSLNKELATYHLQLG